MDTQPVRILLIDDDEDQYVIVERYLKRARSGPYEINWVPAYDAAIAAALGGSYELCLLDFQLGAHTGIELLEELRARGVDLPVVLLTGQSSYELDRDAMEKGVSEFLDKNEMTPVLLERALRYALENHRARVALKRMNEELEARVRERTDQLQRSNQNLEQFARMVAEDLQGPVAALEEQVLAMRAHEAAEGPDAARTASRLLDPVLHATQNIGLLVRSVLDHARPADSPAPGEPVALGELVAEAWERMAGTAAALEARLDSGDLPMVRGNRGQLLGLFENLLDNALRYRGEDAPRVAVSAMRVGAQWQVDIADNGCGIEEEDADEIFEMFRKLGTRDARDGAGIGLALCRKIVQHHGGRLWLDSEPGRGSTFHLLLHAAE